MRWLARRIFMCAVVLLVGGCAAMPEPRETTLTLRLLDRSLALGRQHLLRNQLPNGTFNYEYDFVRNTYSSEESQVRQAGALWGVALLHHDAPTAETVGAVIKGLAFFDAASKAPQPHLKYVAYPGEKRGRTGTVALVALALIELLRSKADLPNRKKYERDLEQYLNFLLSLRMRDGRFYGGYLLSNGKGVSRPSPYSDGEALLAFIKAAKYAGHAEHKQIILHSAASMHRRYVTRALARDPDSDITKGFYQWSSMAFYEIYTTGWEGAADYAGRVIELAHWMIDVHEVLVRRKNTGYAYEGITTAYELAKLTGDHAAMEKFRAVIEQGLFELTTWQVGSPVENAYLRRHNNRSPLAIGGVMNGASYPRLRIDVTQHQMHALVLARRYLYQ